MKRKDLKQLLDFFDSGSISDNDWHVFSNQQEARSAFNDIQFLKNNSPADNAGFGPYFKRRVMAEVYSLSKTSISQSLDEVLSRFFSKVMLAGTITILILVLVLFATNGQFDIASLTGIEQDGETNFISSVFNEY